MNLMTRQSMGGGGVLGTSNGICYNQVGGMGFQNMKDKQALRDKVKGGQFHKDPAERKSQFGMLSTKSKSVGVFSKLDKIFEKSFWW